MDPPGSATAVHLAAELFREKAGVDIVHVPYRGTAAGMPDWSPDASP